MAVLQFRVPGLLWLMQKMKGVVDLGAPTRRYKRGNKKLRISGTHVIQWVQGVGDDLAFGQ